MLMFAGLPGQVSRGMSVSILIDGTVVAEVFGPVAPTLDDFILRAVIQAPA